MASASVPVDLEEMECSVCHEFFTDPKLLPCGHCLCRHCLLSWLDSQSQAAALCPLCRCAIVECAQQPPKSFEDIAENFPTDLAMASLVDAHRLLLKDHQCCVCDDVAATSLCLQCGDMLCAQCTQAHKKLTMSKHHSVEALSSLMAETIASNRRGSCTVHAGKETELFCPKHGESICQLCAMSRHRSCPEVTGLDEKMVEARTVLAELVTTLTAGEKNLDCRIRQLDEHIKQTEEQAQVAISEIEAVCARLHKSIKECEDNLTYLVDSSRSYITEVASNKKTYLSQRKGQLTTHKRVVERVQDARSPDTVTNMTPKLKKRVVNLDPGLALMTGANLKFCSRLTFMIDPKAVIIIEDGLSKLGQITDVPVDVTVENQEIEFRFHDNHGGNIVLSRNQQTAKRASGIKEGIVLSSDPMVTNMLYEVRIVDIDDSKRTDYTMFGVLLGSPADVTLPETSEDCHSALVVSSNCVYIQANLELTKKFGALNDVREGSRVGVALDAQRNLHVFMDGKDLGTVPMTTPGSHSGKYYALFDLGFRTPQVRALPCRQMI
ncbi:E3 ubiquitin-protein ligase TRIM71-like [Littorina saxatilis]|uniref:Uncharacterized protein n=1 Tax=Littorina saxatilis TaxID=31220 RepID=A0AAN9ARG2_9CAEN